MHGEKKFLWLDQLPGLNAIPHHIATTIFLSVLLIFLTWIAARRLRKTTAAPDGGLIPEPTLNYRNFFEIVCEQLFKLTESILGHHEAPRYFPLMGTLFIFIFISNAAGLIPGFLPPTENLNTTLALGVFVFIYYNYLGFRENGLSYLKHFAGPVAAMAPFMFLIEIISHTIRPFSLGLRLHINILGDHLVMSIFSGIMPVLLPIPFMFLGLMVAFIQAFVFVLLTMVYISLSTAHEH